MQVFLKCPAEIARKAWEIAAMIKSKTRHGVLAVLGALASSVAFAQSADAIQKKLESEYTLTKTNYDKTDIVTAGSVVVLQKDKVLMLNASSTNPCRNTYKNGQIVQSGPCTANEKFKKMPGIFKSHIPGASSVPDSPASHTFVTGEKFWVTRIDTLSDGVVFTLFTDAVDDIRYSCTLKFVYPHGATPAADQVLNMVGEVLKVQQDDSAQSGDQQQAAAGGQDQGQQQGGQDQQQAGQAGNGQAQAAPPTIELGQTPDQVIGLIGQPEKKIELGGGKEIFVYKDIKVTFVGGKVVDVQ